MESSYYSKGGQDDIKSTDEGVFPDLYEIGTEMILKPEMGNCFLTSAPAN